MRGKTAAILLAALFALAGAPSAFADQPPGQLGYEGQPGNQGRRAQRGRSASGPARLRGPARQSGRPLSDREGVAAASVVLLRPQCSLARACGACGAHNDSAASEQPDRRLIESPRPSARSFIGESAFSPGGKTSGGGDVEGFASSDHDVPLSRRPPDDPLLTAATIGGPERRLGRRERHRQLRRSARRRLDGGQIRKRQDRDKAGRPSPGRSASRRTP